VFIGGFGARMLRFAFSPVMLIASVFCCGFHGQLADFSRLQGQWHVLQGFEMCMQASVGRLAGEAVSLSDFENRGHDKAVGFVGFVAVCCFSRPCRCAITCASVVVIPLG
jgi:hypothetical protein